MTRDALARVREQTRELVIESGDNRRMLRTSLRELRPVLTTGVHSGLKVQALVLPALAAVAGAALVRRTVGLGALYGGLTTAATWALPLYKAWRKARKAA